MNFVKNKKKICIVLFVLLTVLVLGAVVIWRQSNNTMLENNSRPVDNDGISIQISTNSTSYSYGDTIEILTTIKNNTTKEKVYEFTSGCQDADLYVDDSFLTIPRICTDAFSVLKVRPLGFIERKEVFILQPPLEGQETPARIDLLVKNMHITEGRHSVNAQFQDLVSQKVDFEIE